MIWRTLYALSMPSADLPATRLARVEHADWLDCAHSIEPGSIDVLYVDPPFNTGRTRVGSSRGEEQGKGELGPPAYSDSFSSVHAWLGWLRPRLEASFPALKPAASILLHIDWRTCHHARLLLEELLSAEHFVNHLVWAYGLGGSSPRRFARKHDDILFYSLDPARCYFDPPMVPSTSNRMKGALKKATDVLDIPAINNMAAERTGYPTQKPRALLDLLIRACCPEHGTVFDPCCGSGTTAVAAVAAGRRAIVCDVNPVAVSITRGRLSEIEQSGT